MMKRVFWGWDRPVLEKSVDLLTRDWRGGEFDLGDTLIIVPTAESARRLKEAMAHAAAEKGGAVSMPHVWPPERALLTREDRAVMAGDAETHLAWTKVLMEADLEKLLHLFPSPPASRGWDWAVETASAMMDLATTLGAGGMSFASLARMDKPLRDRERWQDLEKIEHAYHATLRKTGLHDVQEIKRARSLQPELPEGVKRVVVLPSPDLPRLFRDWLLAASAKTPVEIHVHAPEALTDRFDAFGAPLISSWSPRSGVSVPLTNEQIHLENDPAEQARRVMDWLRDAAPRGRVALGVCDAEVTAHLEDRLQSEGVRIYEPGGGSASEHGTVQMFLLISELIASDDWSAFAGLLRVPVARDVLGDVRGAFATHLLEASDEFAALHLPVTLSHALEMVDGYVVAKKDKNAAAKALMLAMQQAKEMCVAFETQPLHEAARGLLMRFFGERAYRADDASARHHLELCSAWLARCEELHRSAGALGLKATTSALLAMSLDWLRRQQISDPRGEIDLVLMGWLELLWEPAPALMISGFNEEHVPGILISHPFLPDAMRESLGLACQASRFARDAYLLGALAAQRKPGALHLTCGLWSEGKDTLRPSRLLFLCEDAALVRRVRHLFPKDLETTLPRQPARQRAWKLRPVIAAREPLTTISATRLRSYLTCPFRYYLDHVLGMGAVSAAPAEWDALSFGNLIHHALRVFDTDEGRKCGKDAEALAALLVERAKSWAHAMHGSRLPVPVQLQFDSALQRLRAAAQQQAEHRNAGWVIEEVEKSFGAEGSKATPLIIEGARFHGTIDRVDGNGQGGCLVIDYKSSDAAPSPAKAHLKEIKDIERLEEHERWTAFHHTGSGKTYRWLDLQLPLYAKVWSLNTSGSVSAAYFNLPKAIEGTKLEVFEELDNEMIAAAVACAEEAVSRINRGIFWPPARELRAEDYPGLIHGLAEEAVEHETLHGTA